MELNVSGEICSFAQEEEPPGLSNRQLQQTAAAANGSQKYDEDAPHLCSSHFRSKLVIVNKNSFLDDAVNQY
jgi:hypothetical protein